MAFEFPDRGLVFWPVGNGDSTTIVIDSETVVQVDLRHLGSSAGEGDPAWEVIDELKKCLPRRGGRPYLSVFALTHPDQDHCQGFERLLDEVDIGELWFTPRIFKEYTKDCCEDAKVFKKEAKRRVDATIKAGGDPGAGDRVRVFGYDSLLKEEDYEGLPKDRLIVPGNALSTVDEVDVADKFRAFVHAPFKDEDGNAERNDTSLGLQVTLYDGETRLRALLLGDLQYPHVKRVFDLSDEDDVAWNVMLSAHHCSKCVMYWRDGEEGEEVLKQDILDQMEAAALSPNYVVASARPVPSSNKPGDNPPHAKAKKRYEEITSTFVCTMEHPNEEKPEPVVFKLEDSEVKFAGRVGAGRSASAAAAAAWGSDEPPASAVTYG